MSLVSSKEFQKLNATQSLVALYDENMDVKKWCICSNYSPDRKYGEQWDWGHYFDDYDSAMLYVRKNNLTIDVCHEKIDKLKDALGEYLEMEEINKIIENVNEDFFQYKHKTR